MAKARKTNGKRAVPLRSATDIIDRVTLMDNLYMARFFEGQSECVEEVLRAVLDKPDLEVMWSCVERKLVSLQSHSVCLDVFAVDADGRRYDVEIQSDPGRADPRRARYYASFMDVDALQKGARYEDLLDSYVIFITRGDALGRDLPVYHAERVVAEDGTLFGDGTHIVYVNAAYNYGETRLGDVMHDFMCPDPARMRCPVLAERARYLKQSKEGAELMGTVVDEMLDQLREEYREYYREEGLEEGRAEGLELGRAEGYAQAQRENAVRMLASGSLSPQTIADLLAIPVEDVLALADTAE